MTKNKMHVSLATPLYVFIMAQAMFILYIYLPIHNDDAAAVPSSHVHKPHLVFGILSADNKTEARNTLRNTWISTAMNANLPFKLTYKFVLDKPTPNTVEEDKKHEDMIYLNITTHGYAVKFGEKMYLWMKYVLKHYPDVFIAARIDDDVFLCVPQVFEILDLIKSRKLYYGWAYGKGTHINKERRVDEMFVVFGRELMERITDREYCQDMKRCDAQRQLVEFNWGSKTVGTWLSIYDDVDFITDNKRIIHFKRGKEEKYAHYIRPDFCNNYFLYHKSAPEVMRELHMYNKLTKGNHNSYSEFSTNTLEANTGTLFTGNISRDLPLTKTASDKPPHVKKDGMKNCDAWAVVTTIYRLSDAVKLVSKDPRWCLVVVADIKTPEKKSYLEGLESSNVKFLSVKDQYEQYPVLVKNIPLNNFGRKNIGYVYAIHHGAKAIWDFDDDNLGIIDLKDFNSKTKLVTACDSFNHNVANPYPYFGVKENRTWPRGFPLQFIKRMSFIPKVCKLQKKVKLGVVQSLANTEPDVDAIYRLTFDTPFNFTANKQSHLPFVLPENVYAPFNAQATLWFPAAFRYMALPVSVPGRVSDIWRSYIAQYFMHKDEIKLSFSSPYVNQIRNEHNNMKDFNAELDLYHKSWQLIEFLSSNESSQIQNITVMYEHLYRRKYLEKKDLNFINAWIDTFEQI